MFVLLWRLCAVAALAAARELDPAACSARFDVQRDKIIRTEESREMGARYLSELDVGARAECLRLCCETDACDVFVYEEKSPGSCYLFACGPPEDFRCKFTAHGNFSSGVLALARRLAELQDRAAAAAPPSHELQLQRLRDSDTGQNVILPEIHSMTTSTARPVPSPAPAPRPAPHPAPRPAPHPALLTPQTPARRCSRYQFECHSGGECIAVYNACDGVPQCADGSDEAPELGCPSSAPVAPPAPAAPVQPAALPPPSRVPAPPTAPPNDVDAERWPHRLTQAQQQHRYNVAETSGSHIFSHKGGLLQEPREEPGGSVGSAQYGGFDPSLPAWPRAPWSQSQAAMMDGAWGGGYGRMDWPEPDPRRAWPVPPPRLDQETGVPIYVPQKTMPELPPPAAVYAAVAPRDQPKKGPTPGRHPPPQPQATPATSAPDPPPVEDEKPSIIEKTNKKTVKEKGTVEADIEVRTGSHGAGAAGAAGAGGTAGVHAHFLSDERDGLSEHPPAAVLLLVLGVAMTAALALLAGCRARAARRRLRRGKSPFAHDADYLVNGMYL